MASAVVPPEQQCVDDAAPAELGAGRQVAGRRPEVGTRLLVRARPDVDVWVDEELAFPAERPVMGGQRLLDQVDRFPLALADAHRVSVSRNHLGRAGFDEPDLQPTLRQDVDCRVFFGHPDWVRAYRNQGPERENADVLCDIGDNAGDDRARRPEVIDPRMVLVCDDVDADVIAQAVFIEDLVVKLRGDLRVAILVRQTRPHRLRPVPEPRSGRTGRGSRSGSRVSLNLFPAARCSAE